MRVDEAKDGVWVKILGSQNMILATNSGDKKNDNDFGVLVGSIFISPRLVFCFHGKIYVEGVHLMCCMFKYSVGTSTMEA